MKGAALAPPFSCTTKYSSDVYSPRPPDIRVRLLPTKPPVHFTTEQPGRDSNPLAVKSWKVNWNELSTIFKYSPEIRNPIHTTNTIENFNRQLRKVTKTKSAFVSDDALMKILYLTLLFPTLTG